MNTYELYDGCYGKVTGHSHSGTFILLDNGQPAFAPRVFTLLPGTRVLCSVQRKATEEKWMLVSVDSIDEMEMYA